MYFLEAALLAHPTKPVTAAVHLIAQSRLMRIMGHTQYSDHSLRAGLHLTAQRQQNNPGLSNLL